MSAGIWFWLLYVICILFGGWSVWPEDNSRFRPLGIWFVTFVLFGLLGWKTFGPPIQ